MIVYRYVQRAGGRTSQVGKNKSRSIYIGNTAAFGIKIFIRWGVGLFLPVCGEEIFHLSH